jgi:hypothetical protein
MGSAGGNGGTSSGSNKVGKLLLGGGAAAILTTIIIIFGPGGGDAPPARPEPTAPVPSGGGAGPTVPSSGAPTHAPLPTMIPTAVGSEGEATLTIIAYGLPARIAPTHQGTNEVLNGEFREQCTPEVQFPKPCIFDYKVKKGSAYTITAGDARAGYWSTLHSVSGPGCNLQGGSGQDVSCTIQVFGDVEITAKWATDQLVYPACPANTGPIRPAWLRC